MPCLRPRPDLLPLCGHVLYVLQDPSGTSEFKPMDGVTVEWEGEAPAAAAAAPDAAAPAAGAAESGEQPQPPAAEQQ